MPFVFNFLTQDRSDYIKSVRLPNATTIKLTNQTVLCRQCELVPLGFRKKKEVCSQHYEFLTCQNMINMGSKDLDGIQINVGFTSKLINNVLLSNSRLSGLCSGMILYKIVTYYNSLNFP